jgi:hypothetical protein
MRRRSGGDCHLLSCTNRYSSRGMGQRGRRKAAPPPGPYVRLAQRRPFSRRARYEGCAGRPAQSLNHGRRAGSFSITYVGLDVHKATIADASVVGTAVGRGPGALPRHRTRIGLCRKSSPSALSTANPTGKRFGEAKETGPLFWRKWPIRRDRDFMSTLTSLQQKRLGVAARADALIAGEPEPWTSACVQVVCRFYGASGEDYIHRRGCKPSDGAPHATAAQAE